MAKKGGGTRATSAARAEFEALLQPLLESAYGYAVNLTRNEADAEDLIQEAALLAFRGFGSFTPGTNFKGWFFKILTNAYISSYRKKKRRPTSVDFDDVPEMYMYQKSSETGLLKRDPDPASQLMDKIDVEAVKDALDELPDEYRMVATLYFMQELSYQEIAEVLDIPVGTVRSRLHRGRRILQKLLWRVAEERGIVGELASQEGN